MTVSAAPIVRIRDLVKEYRRGSEVVRVLDGLSLEIARGDAALTAEGLVDLGGRELGDGALASEIGRASCRERVSVVV